MKINKLLMLGLVTILASCGTGGGTTAYFKNGTTVEGQPITDTFDLSKKDDVLALLEECYDLADAATDYEAFEAKYEEINQYYDEIDKALNASSLLYYMYGKEEDQNNKLALYDLLLSIYNKADKIHHLIFNNAFKDRFYEGMSDEEILEEIGDEYPDGYYEKLNRSKELEADYQKLNPEAFNFGSKVKNIYLEFVQNAKELASYTPYDNYLEYAYKEVYGRNYDYRVTDNFYQYVKDYVAPMASQSYNSVVAAINWSQSVYNAFLDYAYDGNGFTKHFDKIQAYTDYFGGEYKRIMDDCWYQSNNYYISYEDKATTAAFTETNKGYMFFGKRYEMNTIIHESGHYYNTKVNNGDQNICFDLAETQSQANEMLFVNYLLQNNYYVGDVANVIEQYNLFEMCSNIVTATLVNEFEKWAYTTDELTTSAMDAKARELEKECGFTGAEGTYSPNLVDYWKYVCIENPLYYISYATSAVGALEINATAKNDLKAGIEQYEKIIHYNEGDEGDFIKVYQDAGLASPFTEQAFINIFGAK